MRRNAQAAEAAPRAVKAWRNSRTLTWTVLPGCLSGIKAGYKAGNEIKAKGRFPGLMLYFLTFKW